MRREDVPNTIWDERDALSNDAMLLHLWSFTNPRCGMSGIYPVPRRKIAEGRLGEGDRLDAALAELEAAGLVVYRAPWLWSVERVANLTTKSKQIAKSIAKGLRAVECPEIVAAFAEQYAESRYAEILRELPESEGGLDLGALKRRVSSESHESALTSEIPRLNRVSVVGVGAGVKGRGSEDSSPKSAPTSADVADDWLDTALSEDGAR